ncbi:hypothetical protein [Saccharopolyspora sp. ASAGF58]|uniref:hypothetical protein n=1 Tax=Saccharopolyspora sp. ASAGF58 TaxID=2719023 RepID=UPI001440230B|nr:hypothetical protein [Saccharopolyspora sp. ASAGF58]QIZ36192.1 hypothetical protein FDZ84_17760 [Saccharopolyspora sp. ASAGF58]
MADARPAVQRELCSAWDLFDPEVYARTVLKDAALDNGHVVARSVDQVANTEHLRCLRNLEVDITKDRVADLKFLESVRDLTRLALFPNGTVSAAPLAEHLQLQELYLRRGGRWTELKVIRRLSKLRILGIYQQPHMRSLTFLADLRSLEGIGLFGMDRITDYQPITTMSSLRSLTITGFRRADALAPIAELSELRGLALHNSNAADFEHVLPRFNNVQRCRGWKSGTARFRVCRLCAICLPSDICCCRLAQRSRTCGLCGKWRACTPLRCGTSTTSTSRRWPTCSCNCSSAGQAPSEV